MTKNGLRWGILGAGGIAALQVSDMKQHGFEVAAVAARDLAKAQAFADEHGIPTAYGSYEEARRRPERRCDLRRDRAPRSRVGRTARARRRQARAGREAVHDGCRRSPRRSSNSPRRRTSSSSRRCGPGGCRTWCASARSSPKVCSATCAFCTPTTIRTTRATSACTSANSAAVPCSTSASTPCRLRGMSSAPRHPFRRTPR